MGLRGRVETSVWIVETSACNANRASSEAAAARVWSDVTMCLATAGGRDVHGVVSCETCITDCVIAGNCRHLLRNRASVSVVV